MKRAINSANDMSVLRYNLTACNDQLLRLSKMQRYPSFTLVEYELTEAHKLTIGEKTYAMYPDADHSQFEQLTRELTADELAEIERSEQDVREWLDKAGE